MPHLCQIKVDVDFLTDQELEKWAKAEGRPKKRQLEVLARKLTAIRKTRPAELEKLGLIDALAVIRE